MIFKINQTYQKAGLFLLGLFFACSLLMYSNWIVNKLREDNREIVKIYSEIIAKSLNETSTSDLGFVFNEIIQKVQFPIIYSDSEKNPNYYKNLVEGLSEIELKSIIQSMDDLNEPIPITYTLKGEKILLGFLHYGESSIIMSLKWLPLIELLILLLFIILFTISFNSVNKIEKSNIWNGMAKETAHQLGTPISALMGWVQRMKNNPQKSTLIVNEMEIDINRLTEISDRFSKIGSSVKLTEVNLSQLVKENIKYLKKRYSFNDDSLKISIEEIASPIIVGDYTLIGWAIENMIKNSIDSIEIDKRIIKVIIHENDKSGIIYIEDNGKGIERHNWNNIFKPGFTTKLRGWGIGLSLVKRIIEELHHGKISVFKSQNNKGTAFKIILNKK